MTASSLSHLLADWLRKISIIAFREHLNNGGDVDEEAEKGSHSGRGRMRKLRLEERSFYVHL